MFSVEGSRVESDQLSLATAGIASVTLNVQGRASHAGAAPERGRNALYELAHQILQTRDLSDPATGLKMNWTLASAGTNRNVIPAMARRSPTCACCASPTTTASSRRCASASRTSSCPTPRSS